MCHGTSSKCSDTKNEYVVGLSTRAPSELNSPSRASLCFPGTAWVTVPQQRKKAILHPSRGRSRRAAKPKRLDNRRVRGPGVAWAHGCRVPSTRARRGVQQWWECLPDSFPAGTPEVRSGDSPWEGRSALPERLWGSLTNFGVFQNSGCSLVFTPKADQ